MKLTPKVTELLFELRHKESFENMQILAGDLKQLNSKLLRLYRTTNNQESKGLIVDLLSEVGYPWFRKFAQRNSSATAVALSRLSEAQFLELLPANSYFH